MSTARPAPRHRTPRRVCAGPDCAVRGTAESFPTDRYCSHACETRHRGQDLIDAIAHDHRYCGGCGRRLKRVLTFGRVRGLSNDTNVYKPPPKDFQGLQSRTRRATTGEKVRHDGLRPPVIGTGTVCRTCGATDSAGPLAAGEHPMILEAAGLFCDAIEAEGLASMDVRAVCYAVVETRDLALAIGKGVSEEG